MLDLLTKGIFIINIIIILKLDSRTAWSVRVWKLFLNLGVDQKTDLWLNKQKISPEQGLLKFILFNFFLNTQAFLLLFHWNDVSVWHTSHAVRR